MADDQAPPPVAVQAAFEDPPIPMRHLGVAVDIGTFLIVGPSGGYETDVLVRMTGATYNACHNAWSLTVNRLEALPPLALTSPLTLMRHMTRVHETAEVWELNADRVIDIAFVFKESDLEALVYAGQGRLDSFALTADQPSTATFVTFPCDPVNSYQRISYAKRIWRDMDGLRLGFRRILCKEQMHASNFDVKCDKGYISEEAWHYMKRVIERVGQTEEVVCEDGIPSRSLVYELAPAQEGHCKRRLFESEKITFMGTSGMKQVSELFGEGAVVGIRQKRPAISRQGPRPLGVNDKVTWMSTLTMRFAGGCLWYRIAFHSMTFDRDSEGRPVGVENDLLSKFIRRRSSGQRRYDLYDSEDEEEEADVDVVADDNHEQVFDSDLANILVVPRRRFVYEEATYQVVRSLGNDADSGVRVVLAANAGNPDRVVIELNKALVLHLVELRVG